jgi:hypothetical protein
MRRGLLCLYFLMSSKVEFVIRRAAIDPTIFVEALRRKFVYDPNIWINTQTERKGCDTVT